MSDTSRKIHIYPTVDEGTWVVEAIDPAHPREIELAVFSRGRSEERARRYCKEEYGVGCAERDAILRTVASPQTSQRHARAFEMNSKEDTPR
jgi:hypothetical protein